MRAVPPEAKTRTLLSTRPLVRSRRPVLSKTETMAICLSSDILGVQLKAVGDVYLGCRSMCLTRGWKFITAGGGMVGQKLYPAIHVCLYRRHRRSCPAESDLAPSDFTFEDTRPMIGRPLRCEEPVTSRLEAGCMPEIIAIDEYLFLNAMVLSSLPVSSSLFNGRVRSWAYFRALEDNARVRLLIMDLTHRERTSMENHIA